MRRVQFYLDDELDRALTAEADRRGTSRSAIIREAVRAKVGPSFWNKNKGEYDPNAPDPMDKLVGWLVDADPIDDIDGLLYGTLLESSDDAGK